jgi:hypothetical protein
MMRSMLFFTSRRERKVLKLARLLLALDESARHARERPTQKPLRTSLSA